jgi:hypothetical protein
MRSTEEADTPMEYNQTTESDEEDYSSEFKTQ